MPQEARDAKKRAYYEIMCFVNLFVLFCCVG